MLFMSNLLSAIFVLHTLTSLCLRADSFLGELSKSKDVQTEFPQSGKERIVNRFIRSFTGFTALPVNLLQVIYSGYLPIK